MALTLVVSVAVALAFADSSIVVLALPDLYSEFDISIVTVSWVVTAYNVAIVVGAALLVPIVGRLRPARLAATGFAVFAAASLVCALAGSFDVLVGARAVQGFGAALLLAATLSVLLGLTADEPKARNLWALAATVGAAAGPALGGLLTELFTWRSIFFVQAPVAALALLALASPAVRGAARDRRRPVRARQLVADVGYVLLFAALVGALFLAVLLVIVVWRYTPIQGAVVVSALPIGALVSRPLTRAAPGWAAAAAGGVLLAGGLAALALLPAASPAYAVPALGACGLGLGLLGGVLGPASMPRRGGLLRPANLSIGARHLGFVLGLVAIAPVLAADLDAATQQATRAAAQVILDGRIGLRTKVPLVTDLRDEILATPRGRVPDLDAAFAENGAADDADLAVVRDDLSSAIEDTITRSFRPSFALAAGFGALAALPALAVALWREEDEA
jgi:MFS family permease